MICIQKFYPVMALVLFTIMSSIIAMGSYTMTALLYSPGVAKAAERASKRASKPDFTMSDVEKLIQERLAGMADSPGSPVRTPKKRN